MRGMVASLQTMQKRRLTHSLSLTLGFLCILDSVFAFGFVRVIFVFGFGFVFGFVRVV